MRQLARFRGRTETIPTPMLSQEVLPVAVVSLSARVTLLARVSPRLKHAPQVRKAEQRAATLRRFGTRFAGSAPWLSANRLRSFGLP